MQHILDSAEDILHLKGNQPLILENPNRCWWVKSGAVALFAIPLQQGQPNGARQYLFTVPAQEIFWGFDTDNGSTQNRLVAIALEDTTLQPLTLSDLHPLGPSENGFRPNQGLTLIKTWSIRLTNLFDHSDIAFVGLTEDDLIPDNPDLPISLQILHQSFLNSLIQLQTQQATQDYNQFRDRLLLNQQAMSGALGALAGVLNPAAQEASQEGNTLLIAAGACHGHHHPAPRPLH